MRGSRAASEAGACGWAAAGATIAQKAARQLVLYHRRSGGQSQFSSLLELKAPNGRFGPLLAWARENLDAPLTVEEKAQRTPQALPSTVLFMDRLSSHLKCNTC